MRTKTIHVMMLLATSAWALAACSSSSSSTAPEPPSEPPPPPPPPVTTGALSVQLTTQGTELDLDGYLISIDGAATVTAAANTTVTLSTLAAGDHQVLVSGIQCNCALASANPRTVAVTAGQTVNVSYDLACAARSEESAATFIPEPVFNGANEFAARGSQILIVSARRRGQPISSGQQPSGPLRWSVKNFDSSLPIRTTTFNDPVQFLQQPYSMLLEPDGTARVLLDRFTQPDRNSAQNISLQIASVGNAFESTPAAPAFDMLVPADEVGVAQGIQLASGPMAVYQNVLAATDITTFTSWRAGAAPAPAANAIDSSLTRRYFSIASSGTEYLLASLDYSSFSFGRVDVQRLTSTGAAAGLRTLIDGNALSQLSPTPPAITWCGDRYALAWWGQLPYGPNGTTHVQLRATTLDANGNPLQSTVNITGDLDVTAEFEMKQPALMCEGSSSLTLAYAPNSGSIEILNMDLSLAPLSSRTISAPDRMQTGTSPRIFADTDSYVVGWTQGQGTLGFSRFCRR